MEQFSNEGRSRRRAYSKEFKAQLVAACAQPGASVGGVALSHGLHANMVHRWIREAQTVRTSPRTRAEAEPSFISLPLTAAVARPHHAYLFANARANRMKVLVHDGFGVWLAARLNQGKFAWGDERLGLRLTLSAEQLQALVTGLPWQRLANGAVITVL
jgi:transposase-like protein